MSAIEWVFLLFCVVLFVVVVGAFARSDYDGPTDPWEQWDGEIPDELEDRP